MLTLAFDTATDIATSALVWDGEVLGELRSRPVSVLEDVDALFRRGGVRPSQLEGLVVGTGPGSFTGLRMGLASARALSLSLGVPVAGVSTLEALRAGAPGAVAIVDARRSEVFVLDGAMRVCRPEDVDVDGRLCVGDGAVRYRVTLEQHGAEIPPDDDEVHVPRARFHVQLAKRFGPADQVEPIYLRIPDAAKARA
jgi:tRNA threonylcarbamoyladenosine biosynthesis protein TsaB